jgi:hypothetical protein
MNPQMTVRPTPSRGDFRFRRFDRVEDFPAAIKKQVAFCRECETAGGSNDEACAEAGLEPRDELRYGRRRKAKIVRGCRKAATLDHTREDGHLASSIRHS